MQIIVIVLGIAHLTTLSSAASDVKGTYWSTQSDAGGCQLPTGSYQVLDALALGQGSALGALKYRPGLCGQVLDVSCGGSSVSAVVVSTCNLGSDSCGVDLIEKTWNKATGNKSPGIVSCTVEMSSKNPLAGGERCFHRTGSAQDGYSRILGVLNTGGKIVTSAKLAGKVGSQSNGAWFEFNAGGQNLFTDSAEVEFTYEGGGKATFSLSDCDGPSSVQIFK